MERPCSLKFFWEETLLDELCGDGGRRLKAYDTLIANQEVMSIRSLSIVAVNGSDVDVKQD